MKTEVLTASAAATQRAALLLRQGRVVAFPTETVYGLGANALDADAVLGIFAAKDRPADNPLIVHITNEDALLPLVTEVNDRARRLMRAFWPGPLTLVLPRADAVPAVVSAGLPTVAVRMPAHPVARALIDASGLPIAAPSANRSGRPSPTTAQHVFADMDGRIPLILDGGAAQVGVESTVVDVTGEAPRLLRPGGITVEMLMEVVPDLTVDPAVLAPLAPGEKAASPGMKHRHYAPRARVVVVRGEPGNVRDVISARYAETEKKGQKAAILCAAPRINVYQNLHTYALGRNEAEMAAALFEAFRALDNQGVQVILAEAVEARGMGLALMNRLLRAADFDVVEA